MALIAHGGPRHTTAFLAYLMRTRIKPVAARSVAVDEPPPAKHHYPPKRERFIESAAMSREMYRL